MRATWYVPPLFVNNRYDFIDPDTLLEPAAEGDEEQSCCYYDIVKKREGRPPVTVAEIDGYMLDHVYRPFLREAIVQQPWIFRVLLSRNERDGLSRRLSEEVAAEANVDADSSTLTTHCVAADRGGSSLV